MIVAKINREIYRCITEDIVTDEVVLTDERIQHIKHRHPNDFESYALYIKDMLEKPAYIIEDPDPNTAFVLKEYRMVAHQFRLILRLQTAKDPMGRKNSVLTFQYIKRREYDRLLRNKKILYKDPEL